jgi:hypothetical protein
MLCIWRLILGESPRSLLNRKVGGPQSRSGRCAEWTSFCSSKESNLGSSVVQSVAQPFALETPFSFDSDRSATSSFYVTINVANENIMSFFAVSS